MDLLFSIIAELLLEGSIEASKSKKIPNPLRYFLLGFVVGFFIIVIGLIIFMGVSISKDNLIGGIIIILFGLLLAIMSVIKLKKDYLVKKEELKNTN